MQKIRRRLKMKNPSAKSGSCAPPILYQTSHFWYQTGARWTYFQVENLKKKKSVVNQYSVKTNGEEHRSAALQIFTPYFSSALSPPLSDRSDGLTVTAENVRNTRRAVKVTAAISTPQIPSAKRHCAQTSSDRPLQGAGANWHRCALCALPTHVSRKTAHANSSWRVWAWYKVWAVSTRAGVSPRRIFVKARSKGFRTDVFAPSRVTYIW